MSDDSSDVPIADIRRKLKRLKRNGCNLLVTGNVREEASHRTTRKLLGAPEVTRTRLLALTDHDREDAPVLLPGDVRATDERVRFLQYDSGTRTASVATPAASARSATDAVASETDSSAFDTDSSSVARDLDDFQSALCNAITTAKISESGFDPAELRISVFTLSYLVNRHDPTAVDRFVSAVGDHVRGVGGMAHYHLPVADDSKPVRRLSSLFDARIELREKHGRPEQRWHFPDDDVRTVWVGL
ncbi:hypothetical protein M0R88_07130 [Halorussus gelatinilyticus]|uniref:Uncharacterized protein n=1 Tax=Halorussus gelatinilyticus TaxID=2937524 RepID=A0A8U0IPC5_9EURY|nr:hypothetical protein [Halorussus gelatinilyticus]UPW01859.1 hypothetical protein M0R88_07130 [Halorussus gelatinilyticus]